MKKIVLSLVVCTSLLFSQEVELTKAELEAEIAKAKVHIAQLNKKVKKLEAKLPANEKLITHTELGYIKNSGNTNTETFNLELHLKKGWGNHSVTYFFDGQYANDDQVETKNKFTTELEYGYLFTERFSLMYLTGYKQDKFSGFAYQAYTGPGLNYMLVKTTIQNLKLGGYILYSQDSIKRDIPYNSEEIHKYMAYRTALFYDWQIFSNLKFSQDLTYRSEFSDSQNYFAFSKTALSTKITDIISAGISYKVDYVNKPSESKKNTDKTLTANLIIDY